MRHLAVYVCAPAVAALCSCTRPECGAPPETCASPAAAADTALPMPPKGPPADNFRCHVCHINFADEELAVNHAEAGVGCEKCHGKSDAHCSDEDNITAPDIMYAKEAITPACMACHTALPADHKSVVEGTAEKDRFCTDCHGEHRVAVRSRAWDKTTGKLIVR
ncbi:MAG TPA: hypothetical protein DCM87_08490 [Planctomycetes bacterium]|nr:hypothetical protein [Planctomycetota bacterium]